MLGRLCLASIPYQAHIIHPILKMLMLNVRFCIKSNECCQLEPTITQFGESPIKNGGGTRCVKRSWSFVEPGVYIFLVAHGFKALKNRDMVFVLQKGFAIVRVDGGCPQFCDLRPFREFPFLYEMAFMQTGK